MKWKKTNMVKEKVQFIINCWNATIFLTQIKTLSALSAKKQKFCTVLLMNVSISYCWIFLYYLPFHFIIYFIFSLFILFIILENYLLACWNLQHAVSFYLLFWSGLLQLVNQSQFMWLFQAVNSTSSILNSLFDSFCKYMF